MTTRTSSSSSSSSASRAPAQVPVEIVWARGERRVFRLSREVGVEGMLLRFPAPFPEGEQVRVSFALPDMSIPLAMAAEVIDGGVELRFGVVDANARSVLATYAQKRNQE
jgi:hypothetical protein